MVNVKIDGIYCPKCQKLHPTLFWHDKYNEYLLPSRFHEIYRDAEDRFGLTDSDEACQKAYQDRMDLMQIKRIEHAGKCAIFSSLTNYIDVNTEQFVCSDECLERMR